MRNKTQVMPNINISVQLHPGVPSQNIKAEGREGKNKVYK